MSISFLLRFQEECLPDNHPGDRCGTQTVTRVAGEGPDNDPGARELSPDYSHPLI